MKVCKFGGTSLANAVQIEKVIKIIQSDPERRCIVVSAPGKRNSQDKKITDLLHELPRNYGINRKYSDATLVTIKDRYFEIAGDLGIRIDLESEFDEIERSFYSGCSLDYLISRGEYLSGKIVSTALGYDFVDPADCIFFNNQGRCVKSFSHFKPKFSGRKIVVPGFYGSMPDGSIKTFSRGGSDITGAIVASAVGAEVYENWTDVSGLLMTDPKIVSRPKKIEIVTYRELRELSYMGASVFHEEATFPVQKAGIKINIRNTDNPNHPGTFVVPENGFQKGENIITGIAGRKDFSVITVEKKMMNQEVGFVRIILTVLEENNISFEHIPSGIDTVSIIIDNQQLSGKLEKVKTQIRDRCQPDKIESCPGMAMIAVVGRAMAYTPGVAAKVFTALSKEGINIRMINQGSSEISIIIGVENGDYENAIRAIYGAFVE